jgi:hypothetical protein
LNVYVDKGTNSTEYCPSGEANGSSDGQEIPRILWKPNVHYRVHKRPPFVCMLSQITPVHVFPSCCFRYILNITYPSTSSFFQMFFYLRVPQLNPSHTVHFSHLLPVPGTFITCVPHQLLFRSSIKNEMGRACGTYGRQENCVMGFGGET